MTQETKRKYRLRMQTKTILLISVFALFMAAISIFFFSYVIHKNNDTHYKRKADDLSATIAEVVDASEVASLNTKINAILAQDDVQPVLSDADDVEAIEEYISHFSSIVKEPEFISISKDLKRVAIKDSDEISSIYISCVVNTEKVQAFMYLVDVSDEPCPPGLLDPLYDVNKGLLTDPERGFPAYITNTREYGWLCTSGSVIKNGNECVGYAMVDISMQVVHNYEVSSIVRLSAYLVGTIILLCVVGFFIIRYLLVKPVNRLIEATEAFDSENSDPENEVFANANVKTGDELEILANAMINMEKNIHRQVNELKHVNAQLEASEAEVSEMAEIINKDALTGVRNKTAYNRIMKDIEDKIEAKEPVEFGLAMIDLNDLKVINDKNGHNAGDIALIKLSTVICGIFVHSPVFRVGGDEFIVLLQNVDYKRIKKLVAEFNLKIEELQEDEYLTLEEKASAAIGYALYNPKIDKSVNDVFKRADEAMYQRKREMKQ